MTSLVPVDGHVHLHPEFATVEVLDAARAHFDRIDPAAAGVLLLTEVAGVDRFSGLLRETIPGWHVEVTAEARAVRAVPGRGAPVILVAGRQVAAREGLEVLALGCTVPIPDRLPIEETLDAATAAGALPAIPWGFGKWWLRRGKIVARLLASRPNRSLWLGDNGGRWAGRPEPPLFDQARRKGLAIVPGSDPLPFSGQAARAGSYGFLVPGPLPERPAEAVLDAVRAAAPGDLPVYGRRTGVVTFVRNQIAMQLRRRTA